MTELSKNIMGLTKKEALGQYVHDMVDLEIRALSLRNMVEETRKRMYEVRNNANTGISYARSKQERAFQQYVQKKEEEQVGFGKFYFSYYGLGFGFSLIFLLASIIFLIVCIGTYDWEIFLAPVIIFGACAIILVATTLCRAKRNFNEKAREYDKRILYLKKSFEESNQEFLSTINRLETTDIYVKNLCSHANKLEENISELEAVLQQNYALNIIPPDYRRLECLVWIDYAFRNDQVDTMREATLQCDKWVRHQDTMEALRDLAENFRSVSLLLENMNANVSMMSQDLFRMAEAQEEQLSESKSARYAMESVQKSTEKLTIYEDMKRAGTF